jgi:hypothetical protein
MGKMRNTHNILVGKLEGKRLLGRHRRRLECNTRVDLTEIRLSGVDWIHLAQDRNQWRDLGNLLTGWVTISFSRRTLLHGVS